MLISGSVIELAMCYRATGTESELILIWWFEIARAVKRYLGAKVGHPCTWREKKKRRRNKYLLFYIYIYIYCSWGWLFVRARTIGCLLNFITISDPRISKRSWTLWMSFEPQGAVRYLWFCCGIRWNKHTPITTFSIETTWSQWAMSMPLSWTLYRPM